MSDLVETFQVNSCRFATEAELEAAARVKRIAGLIEENTALREQLATAESTIDTLESNARIQAKLLADTGRERDELRKQIIEMEARLNSSGAARALREIECKDLRKQLANAREAAAIGRCYVEAYRNAAMVRRDYAKTEKHEAELKQIDAALTDEERACTCHPDEAPVPCQRKYAFTECQAAALKTAQGEQK